MRIVELSIRLFKGHSWGKHSNHVNCYRELEKLENVVKRKLCHTESLKQLELSSEFSGITQKLEYKLSRGVSWLGQFVIHDPHFSFKSIIPSWFLVNKIKSTNIASIE